MTIHLNDKLNQMLDIAVNDDSYRYRAIKGEHALTLHFSLAQHVEIPVGAWAEFEGERYELEQPSNFKKNSTRNFEYTLVMEAAQAKLKKYKFRNTVDKRLEFPYTARPHEHLQMLVDNMNLRESGWQTGDCIDAVEKLISYNHAFCIDALGQMADEFNTEYEIVGKTIHLRKLEYNKDNPLPLSYGRGNGFRPGVGRSNFGDSKPVEVLFVQGGEDNIDPSKYGNKSLLLPRNASLRYDGTHFENEPGFNSAIARSYITDADGLSIRRADKELQTKEEDSLDCSHIYPKRVGTVSAIEVVNAAKNFYDIIDNSIPADLDYNACLMAGETMTVIFQSGMLAGKEFEVKYYHEAKNGKAARRFEIVPQDIDGQTMPNDTFKPVVGDSYAVFHIALPNAYVCDNTSKSGASWDMFRESVKYFYDNEEQKFSFTGELDGIWAKQDWNNIGGRIRLGGYVLFSDAQFQTEGVAIRIVGIKDYINNPHSPEIELSNETVSNSFISQLNKIEETEVVVDDQYRKALQFTKRRFRDSLETIEMLGDALLDNFTNNINPLAVQTMAALIGDESLQFQFVNNKTNPVEVAHNVTYNSTTRVLVSPAGIIQHMTLGIDTISSSHAANEYRFWDMPAFTTPALDDSKRYYLYAKVNATGATGTFYISEKAIAMKSVSGYYHLLMGVLNSAYDGARSYVSLYGFTEILPGQVVTKKVISANGQNFLDFLNNAFRIGNSATYLDWNASIANVLSMKNATIQMANSAGQTMVYISGTNGSGQFAKGNITWDAAGNLKAKGGTFTNVIIDGSIRTPFRDGYFSLSDDGPITVSTYGLQNNNCVVIPGEASGLYTAFKIPFTNDYNGFRACILNTRYGGRSAVGPISATAPSGYYFHEDGEMLKDLIVNANEGVDIIGVGEGASFKGWLVLNRFRYGVTNSGEGFPLKAVFAGKIEFSGGTPHLVKQKRYNQYWYGAENKKCSLSYMTAAPHYCTIQFPSGTFSSADKYTVLLSGELLRSNNGPGVYASVIERTANSFTVYTGDDASWNDGNFTFIVLATHLWN